MKSTKTKAFVMGRNLFHNSFSQIHRLSEPTCLYYKDLSVFRNICVIFYSGP